MKTRLLLGICFLAVSLPLFAGVDSHKAVYIGGTVSSLKEQAEGVLSTKDEKQLTFVHKKETFAIPYDRIDSLEYGQKAGRRVGLAIAISPIALLSKKRRHYLTVNFNDAQDKQQAAVFELEKRHRASYAIQLGSARTEAARLNTRTMKLVTVPRGTEEGKVNCRIAAIAVVSILSCSVAMYCQAPATSSAEVTNPTTDPRAELAAKLAGVKRIYVESFGDDEISKTLQAMVINALDGTKRFIVTENKDKADAILKGHSLEKTSQEVHATGEGTSVATASGGHSSYGHTAHGGFAGQAMGIEDSKLSTETVNDARLAVRLVAADGDVIWSTTQESLGAKFKSASADVAEKVAKQLVRDIDKATPAKM